MIPAAALNPESASRADSRHADSDRPIALGKFLHLKGRKYFVRGACYGPFRPDSSGSEYGSEKTAEADFELMRRSGINTLRTYTVPPLWLLDLAARYELRVLVGLAWEQHVAFLNDRRLAAAIVRRVQEGVKQCAGHEALLGYALGNEIPAPIVRWYGPRRIQRFLRRLFCAGKSQDPEALFTYVNYPSTEYLQLPFLDFTSFNLYLESHKKLLAYLPRLQNLSGNLPVVLAELGLDSRRNGFAQQARTLSWQIESVFEAGFAGAMIFSWTDEWHRGGMDVEDWDFGLTCRERRPKPALESVRQSFGETPFPAQRLHPLPQVSVVVCVYNGRRTIRQCLDSLLRLNYPNYEIVVVDDGSTDGTSEILEEFSHRPKVRIIRTENRGLSRARNTGMEAARGEIVAYIDSDAYADPEWLSYLARDFQRSDFAAIGGPNIPPRGDGLVSDCVASAPGGPVHVLLSDTEAEHIPGCNMAFRRDRLAEIGGFDAQFRVAGDDVDVCWRIHKRGWRIGFSPSAVVWHHYRSDIRSYWRQQKGYGRAETLLEQKWPEKYNDLGHVVWGGRIYDGSLPGHGPWRIYHGVWGSGLFQSIYQPAPNLLRSFPLTPEWYMVGAALVVLTLMAGLWRPLYLSLPVLLLGTGVPVTWALRNALVHSFRYDRSRRPRRWLMIAVTAFLHLLQPMARLRGRLGRGIRPWLRGRLRLTLPRWRTDRLWSESWHPHQDYLRQAEGALREQGLMVRRGGDFDRWDLEARVGVIGAVRIRCGVEEHGQGRQMVLLRSWPRFSAAGLALVGIFAGLAGIAAFDDSLEASMVLGGAAFLTGFRAWIESAAAAGSWRSVLRADQRRAKPR